VLASLFGLAAWAAVAHNSGSGWVQALGCLLAGFVVIGLGGPAFATRRASVEVTANPTDTTAGLPAAVEVRTSTAVRIEPVDPPGPSVTTAAGIARLELVASRRGPVERVVMHVCSAAPFGFLWWRKRVVVPLVRPMWVAPLATRPDLFELAGARGAALAGDRQRDDQSGAIRGVRPYVAGDSRRMVHWPSSAHRGELMVREAERPDEAARRLEVVLPDDGDAGDAVAARALATVLDLLAGGAAVVLTTTERDGPHTGLVTTPAEAGRRLARAVAAR
jgi:uncharacterized protein (DUF58 family)